MKFKVGDKVKILPVSWRSEYANSVYANRTGVVAEISIPVGIAICYKVALDKPFYDHGCLVTYIYVLDYDNGEESLEPLSDIPKTKCCYNCSFCRAYYSSNEVICRDKNEKIAESEEDAILKTKFCKEFIERYDDDDIGDTI